MFKRTSFSALAKPQKEFFSSKYGFSKKTGFKVGSDVYIIPLGLDSGYYSAECHRVLTHKVNGKEIGFGGSPYPCYIKCEGYDDNGNQKSSLCCQLAQMEKDRFPDKKDSGKRLVSFPTTRVYLPVLILGNVLNDKSKTSYPVTKVSLLRELNTEEGLRFSYLEMASSTFMNEIVKEYGEFLRNSGTIDYDIDQSSEEFFEEIRKRLIHTIIKVRGVEKEGFSAAMKSYSFIPFKDASIASQSGEGERDAIVNYRKNKEVTSQIANFLEIFDHEVENLIKPWAEKDLQEYYNSAIGADLKAPIKPKESEVAEEYADEEVEIIKPVTNEVTEEKQPISDEEFEELLNNPTGLETKTPVTVAAESSTDLDSFDMEEDEEFFA